MTDVPVHHMTGQLVHVLASAVADYAQVRVLDEHGGSTNLAEVEFLDRKPQIAIHRMRGHRK